MCALPLPNSALKMRRGSALFVSLLRSRAGSCKMLRAVHSIYKGEKWRKLETRWTREKERGKQCLNFPNLPALDIQFDGLAFGNKRNSGLISKLGLSSYLQWFVVKKTMYEHSTVLKRNHPCRGMCNIVSFESPIIKAIEKIRKKSISISINISSVFAFDGK